MNSSPTQNSKNPMLKNPDAWSTVLLFDRLAVPLVVRIHRHFRLLSPNHLTALSLIVFCISLIFLFTGRTLVASLMMLASSLLDCMDGKLARLSSRSSTFGKYLDFTVDILIHTLGFIGISVWYVSEENLPSAYLILLWSFYFGVMHTRSLRSNRTRTHLPNLEPTHPTAWSDFCARNRLIKNPLSDVDMAFVVIPVSILFGAHSFTLLLTLSIIALITRIAFQTPSSSLGRFRVLT